MPSLSDSARRPGQASCPPSTDRRRQLSRYAPSRRRWTPEPAGRWRAVHGALATLLVHSLFVPAALAHPSGLPRLREHAKTLVATSADWLFWDWHPSIVIGIAVLALLYGLAITRWRRPEDTVEPLRVRFFYGSLVLAWFVLDGPLHHLADELLFAAHMIQHLTLQLVWAPFFLYGLQPWMLGRPMRALRLTRLAYIVTRPIAAFLLYNGTIWIWHLPYLYNLALFEHEWHIVEHLFFMVTAVIYWWPTLGSLPELPKPTFGAQMMYVFANMVAMKALGMIISLQGEVIYTFYLQVPRVFGLTPLGDQQLGGMLMWLPGGLVLWGGLGYVFLQWARRGTPPRGQTGIASIDRRRAAAKEAL